MAKMQNADLSEWLVANCQHDDAVGTVAVDGEGSSPLWRLSELIGIDTNRYFPVHCSYFQSRDNVQVSVFSIDTTKTGSDVDQICRDAKSNGGPMPVVHFRGTARFEDVVKCFKTLHFVLRQKEYKDVIPYSILEVELPTR